MREDLKKLSQDIKKVYQAESILATITSYSAASEMKKLIEYAMHTNIIKGTMDIVYLCSENPEAQESITKAYDNYLAEKAKQEKEQYTQAYRYAGVYDSISDVPGYGTEWNERCIPDGVCIRGRNSRC